MLAGLEVSGRRHLVRSSNRSAQLHSPGPGLDSGGGRSFIDVDRMATGKFSSTLRSFYRRRFGVRRLCS